MSLDEANKFTGRDCRPTGQLGPCRTRYWVFNEEQLEDVLEEALQELSNRNQRPFDERELVQSVLASDTFRDAGMMKED